MDIQKRARIAALSLKKSEEIIIYSIQLTDAINRGSITPYHFEKQLIVPEPSGSFPIDLDWSQHPDLFKLTADDLQVNA